MKNFTLIYNPYTLKVLFDTDLKGLSVEPEHVCGRRIQTWLPNLIQDVGRCKQSDESIKFVFQGTAEDAGYVSKCVKEYNSIQKTPDALKLESKNLGRETRVTQLLTLVQKNCPKRIREYAADNWEEHNQKLSGLTCNVFEVPIVSVRSVGKSTLADALMCHYLSPVSIGPCTNKIFLFKDRDTFREKRAALLKYTNGESRDWNEKEEITADTVGKWNEDPLVASAEISGDIPDIFQTADRSLVLLDTPGVNGVDDAARRTSVLEMIDKKNPAVVFYLLDAENFDTQDNASLLNDVIGKLGGNAADAEARILFLVNKIDRCAEISGFESENVSAIVERVRTFLGKFGITNPFVLPISARAASAALGVIPQDSRRLNVYVEALRNCDLLKYSQPLVGDIAYASLCQIYKKAKTPEEQVEVLSGIRSVKNWLADMLILYSEAVRLKDAVCMLQKWTHDVSEKLVQETEEAQTELDDITKNIQKRDQRINALKEISDYKMNADRLEELDGEEYKTETAVHESERLRGYQEKVLNKMTEKRTGAECAPDEELVDKLTVRLSEIASQYKKIDEPCKEAVWADIEDRIQEFMEEQWDNYEENRIQLSAAPVLQCAKQYSQLLSDVYVRGHVPESAEGITLDVFDGIDESDFDACLESPSGIVENVGMYVSKWFFRGESYWHFDGEEWTKRVIASLKRHFEGIRESLEEDVRAYADEVMRGLYESIPNIGDTLERENQTQNHSREELKNIQDHLKCLREQCDQCKVFDNELVSLLMIDREKGI